ncbi:MAG: Gfo/Idh/MocA family oxidoreductase [Ferruginibacter sp.]|nr:Gfo/Idh/MocA family oxidoreductase [Ferruginibacter sp.]
MEKKNQQPSRRNFIKQVAETALAFGAGSLAAFAAEEKMEERVIRYQKTISSNDRINIAVIGMGIMGNNNLRTALKIPGVQLVAACDLYSGRLERVKEVYGNDIFLTNDYRKILEKQEVDAVIIATSDQWHARITKEALQKGKHVYCEKPMVHFISEGQGVIAAQKAANKTLQIGSQGVSGLVYAKAKELYKTGEIGKLNMVNAVYDRQDALGAWEYTMPADASAQTVDWDRYIAGMPKIPWDAKKFFWWRNYREFGTGVAGDLFVHLLSGTHVITSSKGPESIYASGQLCYWKDGRNVPDVMTGIMHYPETPEHSSFQLTLQVNFVSGTGGSEVIRFVGDEGTMDIGGEGIKVHHSIMPKAPGIGGWDALTTYPKAMQEKLLQKYKEQYSAEQQKREIKPDIVYKQPADFDAHLQHHTNFFDGVRNGKPVVEDAVFGFRAAAPCLACNESYFEKKIINWDPVQMKIKAGK